MKPTASRARLPKDYGLPPDSELLPWSYVEERLTAAMHYWIATVSPDGTPHVRPIDGMWLDGKLYYGGSERSRWVRNIAKNPSISVHLEDAESAVILEGEVTMARPNHELAVRLTDASNAKYHFGQTPELYENAEVGAFSPHVAHAWKTLYKDATRFEFR